MIRLVVLGLPVTQGSKTAIMAGGRARIVEGKGDGRRRHADWRARVAAAAQEAHGERPPIDGPVVVRCTFGLKRPNSAPKRRRTWPIAARSGDVDKLARSVLDSLTGVLFADDSQVVGLVVLKDYSATTGAVIEVESLAIGAIGPADLDQWGRTVSWEPASLPGPKYPAPPAAPEQPTLAGVTS